MSDGGKARRVIFVTHSYDLHPLKYPFTMKPRLLDPNFALVPAKTSGEENTLVVMCSFCMEDARHGSSIFMQVNLSCLRWLEFTLRNFSRLSLFLLAIVYSHSYSVMVQTYVGAQSIVDCGYKYFDSGVKKWGSNEGV